ncbi:MAG: HAD-IA family hydrolase [Candidatus Dadabacteria bacterium]|nr:HAD-IA family hydrolase [Candidatus Dadabacteria bacterium]
MVFYDIKAVFFDAADTLFYIKEGLGNTYLKPAQKYGVNTTPEKLKSAFSKYFPSAPPLAFSNVTREDRVKLEKDWWYDVVKNVYTDIGMFREFDKYFDELFEIFRTSAWEIFPETKNVLTKLKELNYKLIVVSNFDSRVYDVCRNLEILEFFDDFLISSEAGFAKPDPEIFNLALNRNNLVGNNCVHVGDNFENDYVSPSSVGINAVLLDRENDIGNDNINKINELDELLKIIA